jgi:endogenous inhibitor of DNA gyrase (YacG/DUF329 family)
MGGIGFCKGFCRSLDFPIEILRTTSQGLTRRSLANRKDDSKKCRIAVKYTIKHGQKGLSKCRHCSYITATVVRRGLVCPCCGSRLSRPWQVKSSKESYPCAVCGKPIAEIPASYNRKYCSDACQFTGMQRLKTGLYPPATVKPSQTDQGLT